MTDRQIHKLLQQNLAELKPNQIAECYREVLDEASRKNASMLEVLSTLISVEVSARRQRALESRMRKAKLPPRKTLEDYRLYLPQTDTQAKDPSVL